MGNASAWRLDLMTAEGWSNLPLGYEGAAEPLEGDATVGTLRLSHGGDHWDGDDEAMVLRTVPRSGAIRMLATVALAPAGAGEGPAPRLPVAFWRRGFVPGIRTGDVVSLGDEEGRALRSVDADALRGLLSLVFCWGLPRRFDPLIEQARSELGVWLPWWALARLAPMSLEPFFNLGVPVESENRARFERALTLLANCGEPPSRWPCRACAEAFEQVAPPSDQRGRSGARSDWALAWSKLSALLSAPSRDELLSLLEGLDALSSPADRARACRQLSAVSPRVLLWHLPAIARRWRPKSSARTYVWRVLQLLDAWHTTRSDLRATAEQCRAMFESSGWSEDVARASRPLREMALARLDGDRRLLAGLAVREEVGRVRRHLTPLGVARYIDLSRTAAPGFDATRAELLAVGRKLVDHLLFRLETDAVDAPPALPPDEESEALGLAEVWMSPVLALPSGGEDRKVRVRAWCSLEWARPALEADARARDPALAEVFAAVECPREALDAVAERPSTPAAVEEAKALWMKLEVALQHRAELDQLPRAPEPPSVPGGSRIVESAAWLEGWTRALPFLPEGDQRVVAERIMDLYRGGHVPHADLTGDLERAEGRGDPDDHAALRAANENWHLKTLRGFLRASESACPVGWAEVFAARLDALEREGRGLVEDDRALTLFHLLMTVGSRRLALPVWLHAAEQARGEPALQQRVVEALTTREDLPAWLTEREVSAMLDEVLATAEGHLLKSVVWTLAPAVLRPALAWTVNDATSFMAQLWDSTAVSVLRAAGASTRSDWAALCVEVLREAALRPALERARVDANFRGRALRGLEAIDPAAAAETASALLARGGRDDLETVRLLFTGLTLWRPELEGPFWGLWDRLGAGGDGRRAVYSRLGLLHRERPDGGLRALVKALGERLRDRVDAAVPDQRIAGLHLLSSPDAGWWDGALIDEVARAMTGDALGLDLDLGET